MTNDVYGELISEDFVENPRNAYGVTEGTRHARPRLMIAQNRPILVNDGGSSYRASQSYKDSLSTAKDLVTQADEALKQASSAAARAEAYRPGSALSNTAQGALQEAKLAAARAHTNYAALEEADKRGEVETLMNRLQGNAKTAQDMRELARSSANHAQSRHTTPTPAVPRPGTAQSGGSTVITSQSPAVESPASAFGGCEPRSSANTTITAILGTLMGWLYKIDEYDIDEEVRRYNIRQSIESEHIQDYTFWSILGLSAASSKEAYLAAGAVALADGPELGPTDAAAFLLSLGVSAALLTRAIEVYNMMSWEEPEPHIIIDPLPDYHRPGGIPPPAVQVGERVNERFIVGRAPL